MPHDDALARLRTLLPLEARQRALPAALRRLHQLELRHLFAHGAPLADVELDATLGELARAGALATLAGADLVVLDASAARVVGAYPMTTEQTQHRVQLGTRELFAMCSVDALAIGAIFDAEVVIRSRCHVTEAPLELAQHGSVLERAPHLDVQVGIAWQPPGSCAAHSLCREMIFLRDAATASAWQRADPERRQLLSLEAALAVGTAFFAPLLRE